jgi:acyl carrier protein
MNRNELINFIISQLDEICIENELSIEDLSENTTLFGTDSILDSLALVGLIVKLEEYIFEKTGKEIQIIEDTDIISNSESPFKNAKSLSDLILTKLNAV